MGIGHKKCKPASVQEVVQLRKHHILYKQFRYKYQHLLLPDATQQVISKLLKQALQTATDGQHFLFIQQAEAPWSLEQ